jgi:hypothetical protein
MRILRPLPMSLNTVAILTTLFAGFGSLILMIRRMEKRFDFILIEHETLMLWYAKQLGVKLEDLPTRTGGLRP